MGKIYKYTLQLKVSFFLTYIVVLLDLGVPSKQICIVTPEFKAGKSCFNNREVDLKVKIEE